MRELPDDEWFDLGELEEEEARLHDPDLFSLAAALEGWRPTRFIPVSEEALDVLLFDEDWREFERHNYYAQFQEV